MGKDLKKGDRVEWLTSQGRTTGRVETKLTSPTKIKGHRVAASRKSPEYLVRSEKSGKWAAHKPESLKRKASGERKEILDTFREVVNMSPGELEEWLETPESQEVGYKREGARESVGHESGRRIVELLRTRHEDYREEDYAHMRKVIGYVHRHKAQEPKGDKRDTPWRYSLMNWGHDPLK